MRSSAPDGSRSCATRIATWSTFIEARAMSSSPVARAQPLPSIAAAASMPPA